MPIAEGRGPCARGPYVSSYGLDWCQAKDEYKTPHEGLDSLSRLQYFPVYSNRWHCLSLLSFLELLVSLLCTGGVANANGGFFLPGLGNSLLSETSFQCPAVPSGRRLRSGGKNTVCAWYPAQYSSHALHRLWHYSCQRFRHIYCYFEFVRSRRQPPWQKIRYLLQQVSSTTFSSGEFVEIFLELGHILLCSTNCKSFVYTLKTIGLMNLP